RTWRTTASVTCAGLGLVDFRRGFRPTVVNLAEDDDDDSRHRGSADAKRRGGPAPGRALAVPQEGDPRHRRGVDVRRDGDPARWVRRADLRRALEPRRTDAGSGQQCRTGGIALRLARSRARSGPNWAAHDLPVLDPVVRRLHRGDRARLGAVVGDDVPLPRRARPWRDARRRPVDARRVPAAAAAGAAARLPRLLVAGRAACSDGALVHLPRADL